MNTTIESILSKPVTRKEFLQQAGFALLAATGAGVMVKNLKLQPGAKQSSAGYGSSAYGGKRR